MGIFTIGHSTYDRDTFVRMAHGIDTIIDVRSHPVSKHVPDYDRENMPGWLPPGLNYVWWPELGGWDARHIQDPDLVARMTAVGVDLRAYGRGVFPRQRIGVDRPGGNEGWINQGLYDYSWFTTLPEFDAGIERLIIVGNSQRVAIMCCEWAWWRCHRSMVADRLTWLNIPVFHLTKPTQRNSITGNYSRHPGDRIDRYHPGVIASWQAHRRTLDSRASGMV